MGIEKNGHCDSQVAHGDISLENALLSPDGEVQQEHWDFAWSSLYVVCKLPFSCGDCHFELEDSAIVDWKLNRRQSYVQLRTSGAFGRFRRLSREAWLRIGKSFSQNNVPKGSAMMTGTFNGATFMIASATSCSSQAESVFQTNRPTPRDA